MNLSVFQWHIAVPLLHSRKNYFLYWYIIHSERNVDLVSFWCSKNVVTLKNKRLFVALKRFLQVKGGTKMQKVAGIHRLIEFSEILQNLHPVQVTIVKWLLCDKGKTKKEVAQHLQIDMKTATYHLRELRRKKVVIPRRDVEPCALLLEYIIRETLHKDGKFSVMSLH
jgi:DNA-binding MarR family transcriptional regulator